MIEIRLPNGFGSIVKLSGNRRKPYMARVTLGYEFDEEGKRGKEIRKAIGYYTSPKEALQALSDYNKNPFNIESSTITFEEVYEKWNETKFENISQSNKNGYIASFKAVPSLHKLKFVDIKADHMIDALKKSGKGYDTQRKIKVLFSQLFGYAMQNDIVSKDYSEFVQLGKKEGKSDRKPFTKKEIDRLFEVIDSHEIVDTILIMIYTGLRIGELLEMKSADVHIEERYMIGGFKTEAGTDRVIPVNNKILHLIQKRLEDSNEYLIVRKNGKPYKYDNYYRENWQPLMEQLGMVHKPHDARHTFGTIAKKAGMDNIAIQRIMGHSSYEITANIYTHTDVEMLRDAVDIL